jgi:hypothetical protein
MSCALLRGARRARGARAARGACGARFIYILHQNSQRQKTACALFFLKGYSQNLIFKAQMTRRAICYNMLFELGPKRNF